MEFFFWIGILLLVDGSIGLLMMERWGNMLSPRVIRRIAFSELFAGTCMLLMHYFV